MKRKPADDSTSIGSILLDMGAITKEQLVEVVKQQQQLTEEQLLGQLMIACKLCTPQQIRKALEVQLGKRSLNNDERALAQFDIAIIRRRKTNEQRCEAARRANRSVTGPVTVAKAD